MDYYRLLEKYVYLSDKGPYLTREEYEVYQTVKNAPELRDIVKIIDSLPNKDEKYKVVDKYKSNLDNKKQKELEKDALEKKFGIKLDNIEYKKLSNGLNIIAFFDPRYGRKRLIEYNYAKSLVTEFSNVQNSNELYQTNNYEENANNIAKEEAVMKELNMIEIDRFKENYSELINMIPINEQYKVEMINKLLNQSDSINLKYINLDNMVALDNEGNIVEAYRTNSLNEEEVHVGETISYEGNVKSIDNIGNVQYNDGINYTKIDQDVKKDDITPTKIDTKGEIKIPVSEYTESQDFKHIVKEEMEKHNLSDSVDERYNKVIDYSNDLSKLESDFENKTINENEYDFYKVLCEEYVKTNALEQIQARKLIYENKESGFVTILLISLVAIAIGLIVLILLNL